MGRYFITLEVEMSRDDHGVIAEAQDRAEARVKTLPLWKVGKDLCRSMERRFGISPKLIRRSLTGDQSNSWGN